MDLTHTLQAWMPHGMCYLWEPRLLWTHVLSDGAVALAYFAIPPGLFLLAHQTREILRERGIAYSRFPFLNLLYMFGAFIIACGVTHLFGVITVWNPIYWISGTAKAVTAGISLATAVALPVFSPQIAGLFVSYLEVDEKRAQLERSNQALARAQEERAIAIRTMSGWLAHDLNNRLQAIQGNAELLALGPEPGALETLRAEVERASDTIQELVNVSSFTHRGPTEPVAVGPLVEAVAAEMAPGRIQVDLPEDLVVQADPELLTEVVRELLRNAVEGTTAGDRIVVRGTPPSASPPSGGSVVISNPVQGVPPRIRESITSPFVTTKPGRAGLGMARASRSMLEMGGILGISFADDRIEVRLAFEVEAGEG